MSAASAASAASGMDAKEAIAVIHAARRARDVVVTTMIPARDWMTMSQHALDLVLVPSAMGHATSMGLGLALAHPDRTVIVCNGDGSMLMNLGSLVSIASAGATNVVVIVFDNGTYEVTGAQPIPGAGRVDYCAIARASGFNGVYEFAELQAWRKSIAQLLAHVGPTFVRLYVQSVAGQPGPKSPGPAGERAARFREAMAR